MSGRFFQGLALAVGLLFACAAGWPAMAANEHHPYGVIPYGFIYPSPSHIWGTLDFVYDHDMSKMKNWGPHGQGYYSCGPNGCGPYDYGGCCGLTPLHYNAIAPANFSKPYPATPGLSFYRSTPVGLPPVPGWDIPEYPPGVQPQGYPGYRGLASGITGHHDEGDGPANHWYAGREHEQNFWLRGAAFHGAHPDGGH